MEIRGISLQARAAVNGPKPRDDASAEIQRLEREKQSIAQQIKQLGQSKRGGGAMKNAKEKLQKRLEEIDKQIQQIKQRETTEVQTQEDGTKTPAERFDEFLKNDQEAADGGLYKLEQDENGNRLLVFEGEEKLLEAFKGKKRAD